MAARKRKNSLRKAIAGITRLLAAGTLLIWNLLPYSFFLILGIGIFLGARESLYADPALTVKKVVWSPADSLMEPEKNPIEKKVIGSHLFQVNLRQMALQLEKEPEILKARVYKEFPDTIHVDVERRRPFSLIPIGGRHSFAVVSQDGVIMDYASENNGNLVLIEPKDIIVYGAKGSGIQLKGYSDAVKFIYKYWEDPFSTDERLKKLTLDHLGQLSLVLQNGPVIHIGRYEKEKVRMLLKLKPILNSGQRQEIEYIDLQYDEIVVKRKERKGHG